MSDRLIQKFYAACPLWWWPVLWMQIILMDAQLIQLRERAGDDIDYGIALGRYGTLHLIFVSDNARGYVDPNAWRLSDGHLTDDLMAEYLPDYLWFQCLIVRVSSTYANTRRAKTQTPAYLDPG